MVWVRRLQLAGHGDAGSIITSGAQDVRVVASDGGAALHIQSFSYEFYVTPHPNDSLSVSPVYEIRVTTGVFNTLPFNTDRVFVGDPIHQQSRWVFQIQPAPANCGNCGVPVITIFTRETQ
jgi:hypothetical protein